jgi:hypothetical protein
MQMHQAIVKGVPGSFPSPDSYNLIFLTVASSSLLPLVLAIFIKRRLAPLPSPLNGQAGQG